MKTLDEVIIELENEDLFVDILYYLKEYRNHLNRELDMLCQQKLDCENKIKFLERIHDIEKAIRG